MINKKQIFEKLNIKENDRILEIGNGKNYFIKGFSNRVGKDGRVYYFDTNREALDEVEKLSQINIETYYLHGGEYKIKDELDLIFLNDCYNRFENMKEYFRYMKKYLAKGGRLVIIEPDFKFNLKTLLGKSTKRDIIVEDLVYSGFKLKNEYFFVKDKSFIIFEKE